MTTAANPPKIARPAVVLFATGLAMFTVFLDTTILYVAFPSISADFSDVSAAGLSWVLNAYTILFAALLVPAGRLADRIGRRKTFLAAVVIFTVASMVCGLAPNVPLLVAARAVQAIGAAAMVPSSLALVLQTFPKEAVPKAIAIWAAIGAVAGAAGPTLGAIVIEQLDWRWAFFINLPVGIVSLAVGFKVLPEGREPTRGRLPDPLGAILLILGLAAIAYGIVETETWGWLSWQLATALSVGLVLVALFFIRCSRVDNPVLDLRLFQSPNFRWANLAMLIYSVGFAAMFLGNIIFLTNMWDFSILQAGLGISIGPAIVAVLASRFGQLAGRIGQRRILIPGGLVWAASSAYLWIFASTEPNFLGVYLPALVLGAVGVSMVLPQLNSSIVKDLPPEALGSGSAVGQSVRNLGTTIGVAITIAVVANDPGLTAFHHTWLLIIISGLAVTGLALALPRYRSPISVATSDAPVSAG